MLNEFEQLGDGKVEHGPRIIRWFSTMDSIFEWK